MRTSKYDNENQHAVIEDVSLMQLIVTPEKYDGKTVRVFGVSFIEFESNGIWFSKEQLEYGGMKNALWLEPDYDAIGKNRAELAKYNGQYVLVEGVFNKNKLGHLGMYSGSLEKIFRFHPCEMNPRANQRCENEGVPRSNPK